MASTWGRPQPSPRLGSTNASAAAYRPRSSSWLMCRVSTRTRGSRSRSSAPVQLHHSLQRRILAHHKARYLPPCQLILLSGDVQIVTQGTGKVVAKVEL